MFMIYHDNNYNYDDHDHRFIEEQALNSFALDEINSCLRHIRSPLKLHDIQQRHILLFYKLNQSLLSSLNMQFSSSCKLFVTSWRIEDVTSMYHHVCRFINMTHLTWKQLKKHWKVLIQNSAMIIQKEETKESCQDTDVWTHHINEDNDNHNDVLVDEKENQLRINQMMNELFPEKYLVRISTI